MENHQKDLIDLFAEELLKARNEIRYLRKINTILKDKNAVLMSKEKDSLIKEIPIRPINELHSHLKKQNADLTSKEKQGDRMFKEMPIRPINILHMELRRRCYSLKTHFGRNKFKEMVEAFSFDEDDISAMINSLKDAGILYEVKLEDNEQEPYYILIGR